jgi:DNA-binding HxlR family transcriptional regulator
MASKPKSPSRTTTRSTTLGPVLAGLCDWGRKHMQRNVVG